MRIKGLPPLTDEEKLECRDKDKMILSHVGLVYHLVDQYIRHYPDLLCYKEELESVGLGAVVIAVNRIATYDNITGYIVKCVRGAILDAIAAKSLIKTPRGIKALKSYPLTDPVNKKGDNSNETLEAIVSCCDGRDFEIVKLRLSEQSDRQIAKQLGLSRLRVFRLRKSLQKRYREKYDE